MTQTNPLSAYAATRDAEAFAQIVEQYQRLVFATCRRKLHDPADLDDAVQETFLKLAQKAGELKTNVGGWLHRCAVNVSIDINRRRSRQRKHDSAAADMRPEIAGDPQRMLADLREQLDNAMERLDPDQRELIVQRFFVGRPQVEIAADAGVSPSTITNRLERAIERLRSNLKDLGCNGLAAAGGAALLASLLSAEHASAAVPAALTANVMKVGLSGTPKAAAAATAGATSSAAISAWVLAAILVAGAAVGLTVWAFTGKSSNALIPQARTPAETARTGLPVAGAEAPPPQWQTTTQPVTGQPAILSGRVLDRAGKPVANATVTIGGSQSIERAKTGQDGRYAFTTLRADGEYRIGVEADGFVTIEPYIDNLPSVQLSRQSEARRDVVIDRGVRVTVIVKDVATKPLARVRIDADNADDHRTFSQGQVTNAFGALTLTLPPNNRAYVIAGVLDGYAPAHATVTPSSVDEPLNVTLTMIEGVSVTGVAICKDGKPATGWSINAYPEWWASNYVPKGAKIDAEGKFTLTDIAPGQYHVHVSIPTGKGSSSGMPIATITLPPENNQQPIRLNVPLASPSTLTRLVGKLKFNGGTPDYVRVQATGSGDRHFFFGNVEIGRTRGGKPGLAPNEGQFTLESLPPGEYKLQFDSTSIEPKTVERVKVPGELPPIEINVVSKPRLAGTVTDAAGKPITQYAVRVRKIRTLGQGANYVQEARWIQVSNPAGKYDVELVGPGVYQVQASADGYAWLWSPEITIEKGAADVTLRLTPGGALSGTVVDSDGPVEGAKVIPLSMAKSVSMGYAERFGSEAGAVTTDARGLFTLPHLAPGTETIKVIHPHFAPSVVAKLNVTDGQTSDAGTIKLAAGGTVEGVIYDNQGHPAPGVTLQFQDESGYGGGDDEKAGRVAVATSDGKGFFRIEHLPEQVLWVNSAERWNRTGVVRRVVRPVDGRTARLDFGGTAPVTGRLLQGGKPVATRRVELSVESPHFGAVMLNASTDGDGRFSFFGPPAGHYTLYAMNDDQRGDWIRVRGVDVAGQPIDLGDTPIDVGELVLTLDADTSEDLKPITFASISTDMKGKPWQDEISRAAPALGSANTWRAPNVPAGHFRATLYTKGEGNSSMQFNFPFDRHAGASTTPLRVHIPHASATLNVTFADPPPAAGARGRRSAQLRTEDDQVELHVSADNSDTKPVATNVPPGTYRVVDPFTRLPDPAIEPVVLKDGETRDLLIAPQRWPTTQRVTVQVRLWEADGTPLVGMTAKLTGPDGTTIDPTTRSDLGPIFVAAPGHYQLSLDRPGKPPLTREIDITPPNPETASRWSQIDIFAD